MCVWFKKCEYISRLKIAKNLEKGTRMFRMIIYRLFPPLRKHRLFTKEKGKHEEYIFFRKCILKNVYDNFDYFLMNWSFLEFKIEPLCGISEKRFQNPLSSALLWFHRKQLVNFV